MKGFVSRCTPWGTIQTGSLFRLLTDDEKRAVLLHEEGHIKSHDALKRLWWALSLQIFFRQRWVFAQCRQQEFAADAYVKARGAGAAMRSYLRRFPHAGSALYPSSYKRAEALNV